MRSTPSMLAAATLLVLGAVACDAPGRQSAAIVTVRDAGCDSCQIEVSNVVALGDDSLGQLGQPTSVAQDSHGRFLVATRARPGEVVRFSLDGGFDRTAGRLGEGPGEYSLPEFVAVDVHDSIHIIDVGAHRRSVLSSSLTFARSHVLRGSFEWDAVFLADGQIVANLYLASAEDVSHPLHMISPNGEIVKSFGKSQDDTTTAYLPSITFRKIAASGDSAVWSARINAYHIELWSLTGRHLRTVVRDPPPFDPWLRAATLSPETAPHSELRAVHETPDGMLWVLYQVADERWRSSIEDFVTPEGRFFRPRNPDDVYDTIIEVIDVASAALWASARVDAHLLEFIGDSLAYSYREDPVPQVVVWRLALTRPK